MWAKQIINHPFGNGLYHLFMDFKCFNHPVAMITCCKWDDNARSTPVPCTMHSMRHFHEHCCTCLSIQVYTTRNDHYTNLCCWHDVLLYNNHHFTPDFWVCVPIVAAHPSIQLFCSSINIAVWVLSKNGVPQNPIKPSKFPRILVYHQNHSKPITHKSIPIKTKKNYLYIMISFPARIRVNEVCFHEFSFFSDDSLSSWKLPNRSGPGHLPPFFPAVLCAAERCNFTRNPHISLEKTWFPVGFSLNQSTDEKIHVNIQNIHIEILNKHVFLPFHCVSFHFISFVSFMSFMSFIPCILFIPSIPFTQFIPFTSFISFMSFCSFIFHFIHFIHVIHFISLHVISFLSFHFISYHSFIHSFHFCHSFLLSVIHFMSFQINSVQFMSFHVM